MILATHGIIKSILSLDADTQAFITATGITDVTQINAVDYLVKQLKLNSLWTKMQAIYPIVGGTATTHKYNLKNPLDTDAAFRLTFTGSWTHASTGMKPSLAYADTHFSPSDVVSINSSHMSFYSRTNSNGTEVEMGVGQDTLLEARTSGASYMRMFQTTVNTTYSDSDSLGHYVTTRTGSTALAAYKNGVSKATGTTASSTASSASYYIGAWNQAGPAYSSTKECAFASIGTGLSSTNAADLYTIVQAYQTALSRNV
jgi:hypothetical protein